MGLPRSRFGCTTVFDHHYVFPPGRAGILEAEVQAAREFGLRLVASRGSMDLGELRTAACRRTLLVEETDADPRRDRARRRSTARDRAGSAHPDRGRAVLPFPARDDGPDARVGGARAAARAPAPHPPGGDRGGVLPGAIARTTAAPSSTWPSSAGSTGTSGAPTASTSRTRTSRSSRRRRRVSPTAPPRISGRERASRRFASSSMRVYASDSASTGPPNERGDLLGGR